MNNEATPRPGQAAALAASMNSPSPMTPEGETPPAPAANKPIPKVTMRVSLKAPTPGSGPAALAPDPRRDIVAQPAAAPEPVAPPAPMAAPLNISPVLGGQFESMNEVTSSPAPILARTEPSPQALPVQAATTQPAIQSLKKPAKASKTGVWLNAVCILLGIVAVVLIALMLLE